MGSLPTVAVPGCRLKWEWHLCAAGAGSPLLAPLHVQAHTCSVSSTEGWWSSPPLGCCWSVEGMVPSRSICSQCLPFVLWALLDGLCGES